MIWSALAKFASETPLFSWAIVLSAVYPAEILLKRSLSNGNLRNDLYNIGNGLILCLVAFIAMPWAFDFLRGVVIFFGGGLIDIRLPFSPSIARDIVAGFIYLLIYDFFYYWWHRFQHNSVILWKVHQFHHTDKFFGATTFLRQNWVEMILQTFAVMLPVMIIFQLTRIESWVVVSIIAGWSFVTHMDIRFSFGPATRLFTGPQLHRLHHSCLIEHHNSNYAAFFPIWDQIFGTYRPPSKDEFPPTGIAEI